MVQGKLMRFKKLSKKQMGIISATVLVFSCMGASIFASANAKSVYVDSCEVKETNVDIPNVATEGEVPYVVWVEEGQAASADGSSTNSSIAYVWTAEILTDMQIIDLMSGISAKTNELAATDFTSEAEKTKYCNAVSNAENIEFVFVKGENMVIGLGTAKLYIQDNSIKLETASNQKFTKGTYTINGSFVNVEDSTNLTDDAVVSQPVTDGDYTGFETDYDQSTSGDYSDGQYTGDQSTSGDYSDSQTTGDQTTSGEYSDSQTSSSQQTTDSNQTSSQDSVTVTDVANNNDEIPTDNSIEARQIKKELEEKQKQEIPTDNSVEAREIREQIEEKNNKEIPTDNSLEARKYRQKLEQKKGTSSSSNKTGSSSSSSKSEEIKTDNSIEARNIKKRQQEEIPTDNSIKARNYKKQQQEKQQKKTTSSVKTSSSNTSTSQVVETRTRIRKETMQRAKERKGELKTKIKDTISVMKEKAKQAAKKPSNSVKKGTTIRR